MTRRIEHLDGHRGLAILLVILYHAYVRWPAFVPYGTRYADFPIFQFGWLGVELFFLISGFVILMTLEKYSTVREFLARRWLRLFPAMLVCSLLVFTTAGYFVERPAGSPDLRSLIPGLTFIEPAWWQRAVGHPFLILEAAYWSLFVEFKFYVFAALVYFWKGRNVLIGSLLAAFVMSVLSGFAAHAIGGAIASWAQTVATHLSFEYFGWFASGAAFYVYWRDRNRRWFILAVAIALASSAVVRPAAWPTFLAAGTVSVLFAASTVSQTIQGLLRNRTLQFFGFVSYPLYLIHENMMIAMIVKLTPLAAVLPAALLPLFAIAFLSSAAFFIATYAEPLMRRAIDHLSGATLAGLLLLLGLGLYSCGGRVTSDVWTADSSWRVDGSVLSYTGASRDSVAWHTTALPAESATIDFDVEMRQAPGAAQVELIVILYGHGLIDTNDPWSQGLVVNYKYGIKGTEALIRTGGIYASTGTRIVASTQPPLFDGTNRHHWTVRYAANEVSLSIDGLEIFRNVPVVQVPADGYFGVANYGGNTNTFVVTNVVIQ